MYIDNYGNLVASDELYHHGILGMRWGIRRFQPYPGDYKGDGKFVGEKSKESKIITAEPKANSSSSASKSGKTGIKEVDNAVDFIKKNNIPSKANEKWGNLSEDAKESAEIGLIALKKAGRDIGDGGPKSDGSQNWFVFEDQTIGFYEVANLAKQGKSAKEIRNILDESTSVMRSINDRRDDSIDTKIENTAGKGSMESLFDLYDFNSTRNYEPLKKDCENYIDNVVEEVNKRKNLQHSIVPMTINSFGYLVPEDDYLSHHGILGQKWGKQNGPPYPLDDHHHSAAEKKAGWTKSLGNIAKATGRGVAKAARTTKKALIRLNLFPKKLMSNEDIIEKVERLKAEDLLRHAKGKLTADDRVALKIKKKERNQEIIKESLKQLLPAIGKDLIIKQVADRMSYKLEYKKAEDIFDRDLDKKNAMDMARINTSRLESVWKANYESALKSGKTASEARDFANEEESGKKKKKKK